MKRFAILGYPLGHTLSPKLHRLLAEQLGEQIEYSICAIPPEELEEHFEELFCLDGFNITIPYKVRLMEQLDRLDTSARNHGAVNVVSIAADGNGAATTPTASALCAPCSPMECRLRAGYVCWEPVAWAECLPPSALCAAVP